MMVDANGEKFSKSKGNGVDPNKICSTYGADIFRFGSLQLTLLKKLAYQKI